MGGHPRGDFQWQPVGIGEIDRFHEAMIDRPETGHARRVQFVAPVEQFHLVIGLERDMPVKSMHQIEIPLFHRAWRIKEGDEIAIGHAEKQVHERIGPARSRLLLLLHHRLQRQAEHILIKGPRLLGVAAAIGAVVNALQWCRHGEPSLNRRVPCTAAPIKPARRIRPSGWHSGNNSPTYRCRCGSPCLAATTGQTDPAAQGRHAPAPRPVRRA